MKLTKYFMPFAALALLASCSNDNNLTGPTGQEPASAEGDLYFSMTVAAVGNNGTRTTTGNEGKEVGQDVENAISTALVIFAKPQTGTDGYDIVSTAYVGGVADTQITKEGNSYKANFKTSRKDLLDDINANGTDVSDASGKALTYAIFVIANAPYEFTEIYKKNETFPPAEVQGLITLTSDADTYWSDNMFLMSNVELVEKTINTEAIKEGTHITSSDPFPLGTVKVQRAMSRFDLPKDNAYLVFNTTNNNSAIQNLTVTIDGVALINMAQKANLYKVTESHEPGAAPFTYTEGVSILFNNEVNDDTEANWVWSPVQTDFTYPLFDGGVTDGLLAGDQNPFDSFDYTALPEGLGFQEKGDYQKPSDAATTQPTYFKWRYAMENTNPNDKENQVAGNSTGVVFRAKISGTIAGGTNLTATSENDVIYAYNNVILGKADQLLNYVNSPKASDDPGIYDYVVYHFNQAVKDLLAANTTDGGATWTDENGWKKDENGKIVQPTDGATGDAAFSDVDEYLVKTANFTIYRPTNIAAQGQDANWVYYCYYVYWNRHNDNTLNTIMGDMEFATVRNNIYKLRVNKINKLGHPGTPDDDPDPYEPDDPNESDSFYCEVVCEIVDWVVRINEIEF